MLITSAKGIHTSRTQNEPSQQTSLSTRLKKMTNSFRSFSIASPISKRPTPAPAQAAMQLKHTESRLAELESFQTNFTIKGIGKMDYSDSIGLLTQKKNALKSGFNPLSKDMQILNEKIEQASSKLYTKVKTVERAPLNSDLSKAAIKEAITDRNRASNVATTLIERGKNEPWARALRNNMHPITH